MARRVPAICPLFLRMAALLIHAIALLWTAAADSQTKVIGVVAIGAPEIRAPCGPSLAAIRRISLRY